MNPSRICSHGRVLFRGGLEFAANKINDLEFVHRYILIAAPFFFFIQSFPSISTIFRDFQWFRYNCEVWQVACDWLFRFTSIIEYSDLIGSCSCWASHQCFLHAIALLWLANAANGAFFVRFFSKRVSTNEFYPLDQTSPNASWIDDEGSSR